MTPHPSVPVTLGVGSNLGDRRGNLSRALVWLTERGIATPVKVSSVFVGPAMGPPQPDFANLVVLARTRLDPLDLLRELKAIERDMGRVPTERWGPRAIDLDILDYDGRRLDLPGLRVPHPGVADRLFVLAPWSEVAPDFELPGRSRSIAQLLDDLRTRGEPRPSPTESSASPASPTDSARREATR